MFSWFTTQNGEVDDAKYGFIASERFKSTESKECYYSYLWQKHKDPATIQENFEKY